MSGGGNQPVEIAIKGLEVFARHGLLAEERESGQLFKFDLSLWLGSCAACDNDDIEDTVDYAAVADCVTGAATAASYRLLERLAEVVAGELIKRFPRLDRVEVRVAKANPPISHVVKGIAVTVVRERSGG